MTDFTDAATLVKIKRHLDSHGVGCVILGDHIALGLPGDRLTDSLRPERLVRIKSYSESCDAVGCRCDQQC